MIPEEPRSQPSRQFSLASLFLWQVYACLVFATFWASPYLGLTVLLLTLPALVQTFRVLMRHEQPVSVWLKIGLFARGIAIAYLAVLLTIPLLPLAVAAVSALHPPLAQGFEPANLTWTAVCVVLWACTLIPLVEFLGTFLWPAERLLARTPHSASRAEQELRAIVERQRPERSP